MSTLSKKADKAFKKLSEYNPPKGYEKKKKEKPQGYIISDQRGMQLHYEPTPRYKNGGEVCKGGGAAIKGTNFKGVF